MKRFLFVLVVIMAGGTAIACADLSGKWTLEMNRDFRGNPGVPVDCTFKQHRQDLTVKCGTGSEMKGAVRGRKVTWVVEKTGIPPLVEDSLVLTYIAEISESGNTVTGTWRLTSSVLNERGTFKATKKQFDDHRCRRNRAHRQHRDRLRLRRPARSIRWQRGTCPFS